MLKVYRSIDNLLASLEELTMSYHGVTETDEDCDYTSRETVVRRERFLRFTKDVDRGEKNAAEGLLLQR